jgi:predicted nucleotidyltransferase
MEAMIKNQRQAWVDELNIESILSEMVIKIRQVGSPEKIVLFGSRARGNARADSDIDLLVVESSRLPRYKRAGRYRKAVAGMFIAKDIVVWSPEEINEWESVPNAFITTILREGRVLYEA